MNCHYCERETENIVRFADGVERPYCGCEDRKVGEYVERYEAEKNRGLRWSTEMRLQRMGLL